MTSPELRQQILKEWREAETFRAPVLWVDDEGVPDKWKTAFEASANSTVTVATTVDEACRIWNEGGHLGLIVDHQIGNFDRGFELIEKIFGDRKHIPELIAVVTSFPVHHAEELRYSNQGVHIDDHIFLKDESFAQIGEKFRRDLEACMAADGMMPSQLDYLDKL